MRIINKTKQKINESNWLNWVSEYTKTAPGVAYVCYDISKEITDEGDYFYRGGVYSDDIYILVSDTETKRSLDWLFLHELAHWIISENKHMENLTLKKEERLRIAISNRNPYLLEELSFVEYFADMFANMIIGRNYNNDWYYTRKEKHDQSNKTERESSQG